MSGESFHKFTVLPISHFYLTALAMNIFHGKINEFVVLNAKGLVGNARLELLIISLFIYMQDLVIILEAIRIIAIALRPITPSLCLRIYMQLGFSKDQFEAVTWVLSTLYASSFSCNVYF